MLKALLKTMRLRQWTKNAFVLAAVVFDRQLSISNPTPLLRSLAAVLLFCLISSSVYIINDLLDIQADRQHPVKRNRPIASGKLPIPVAIVAAVVFVVTSLTLAFLLAPALALIILLYFVMNLAYSKWLKHVPMLDVLIIAAGFVLRVGAGVVVISVERFSPWLYVVMTLGALYIGFGKRRAELTLLNDKANAHRRVLEGYNLPLLDHLITIVSSSTILTYSLYTFSAPNLPENHAMMLTIPFVLYGVFRYMYLIHVAGKGGEPEELLLTDRPLQIDIVLWIASVLVIFYAF
ncbi:MAG: decaprenyl-phosphate phosphoribosyltransferase [Anaerolineaceae bacterium]|nr:decaprenyl-phosphate phosphoribosyltransferase [Anaerolineaceae bacterium]